MSMKTIKMALVALVFCSPVHAAGNAKGDVAEDFVVATVDGKNIMLSEVVSIQQSHPQIGALPLGSVYEPLLDNLINVTVASEAGKKAKLQKDPEVKKMMKEVEEQILARVYLERRVKEMQTKDRLQKMYEQYKKDHPPQEGMYAAHILLKTEKEAKDVIKQLEKGADFGELANKVSENKGLDGGDLGFFTRETMVPEFSDAAFRMKEGEISKTPVKTKFGYHIIKAGKREMTEVPTFEELEKELTQSFNSTSVEEVLKDLRNKAKVTKTPVEFDPTGNIVKK